MKPTFSEFFCCCFFFISVEGVSLAEIGVTKDEFKVQPDDRLAIKFDSDLLTLHIPSATVDDEATYSIKYDNSAIEDGNILVAVTALESSDRKER